jgi:AcrR family transcriptional regulator
MTMSSSPPTRTPDAVNPTRDKVLDAVIEYLDAGGYDGFGLRAVANRAHVSLATVYKLFPTRDALVAAALLRWHRSHGLADASPLPPGTSVRESLRYLLRQTFEPWELHPNIFKAYVRVLSMPVGAVLHAQTAEALAPMNLTVEARKAKTILADVAYAAGARFAAGVIDVTEFREYLEEVVDWLVADDQSARPTVAASRHAPG